MSTIEEQLVLFAGVNPAVAGLVADRIYPINLPQEPARDGAGAMLPLITYLRISAPRLDTQQDSDTANVRIRFNCWASTYDETVAVAAALRRAINRHGPGLSTLLDTDMDLPREPETGLFRRLQEYLVLTEES